MLPNELELVLDVEADFKLEAGKSIGYIAQNPFSALSPLTKIKKQFFSPLKKVHTLFDAVGLQRDLLERYPSELSGGQLQRVIIAMALENDPRLLLLDEPTTALDPQTTQMILELLVRLQKQNGFKMLFVTHDIASAAKVAEDICVLKDGKIVEFGTNQEVLQTPKQPYTKMLIEANFLHRNFRE